MKKLITNPFTGQTILTENNCGTGSGGFKPGNTCQRGGGSSFGPLGSEEVTNWEDAISWYNEVDYEVEETVRQYQGMNAELLNKDLNAGRTPTGTGQKIDAALNKLHSEGYFKAEGTFARGVPYDPKLKPGDTYTPSSWVSTTVKKDVAVRFSAGGSEGVVNSDPTIIRFKGQKGLLVGGPEEEVILPKGKSYKVVDVRKEKIKRFSWGEEEEIRIVDVEAL